MEEITVPPPFPKPRNLNTRNGNFAIYEASPPEGSPPQSHAAPPIILIHGWPEIAYCWKNQLPALTNAGYRAIAIDLKGFGHSDAPPDPALYDIAHITDDLVAILDELEIEKAIFCGHDWGGAIVWPMAVLHAHRVAGVIGVSTAHLPTPPVPPLTIIEKRFGKKHYFIQFQELGVVEKQFTGQEEKFFRIMFRKPAPREKWASLVPRIFDLPGRLNEGATPSMYEVIINREDLQVYIDAYKKSGFRGGINLYRNIDKNWAILKDRNLKIAQPSLWVGAELDMFLPPEASAKMDDLVDNLTRRTIEGCGHWVSWEEPDILNKHILTWLQKSFQIKTKPQ